MLRAIYDHDVTNSAIAIAVGNLGNIYKLLGKLDEALGAQSECLNMKRAIYGDDVNHPSIARTLGNLGNIYKSFGKLNEEEVMHLECPRMCCERYTGMTRKIL